jgi:stage II sporulation protein D
MRRTIQTRMPPAAPRRTARLAWRAFWLLAAAGAVSCRCNHIEPARQGEIHDVATIRVRLTGPPVAEASLSTTGAYWIKADGRMVVESPTALPPTPVRRSGDNWLVGTRSIPGRELLLLPGPDRHVQLGETAYRGYFRLLPAEGGRLTVINHLDVESYLAGVLAKELYPQWHPQTFRALAVAARTFAMYHMTTFGATHEYDVGDGQASQVYGGLKAETPRSWEAVRETAGVVLACGEPGRERIFMAQYSACCGGRVNGAYVIRNANRVPPLEGGQACSDCSRCSRYRWPTVRVTKSDVFRALASRYGAIARLGGLRGLQVATTTPHGRAVWVEALGPNGKKVRLRAEDVRLALIFRRVPAARRLYSMNCDIVDAGGAIEFRNGCGFGHGVGLCQWGAQGKATRGWTADQILNAYYPGAKLFRVH